MILPLRQLFSHDWQMNGGEAHQADNTWLEFLPVNYYQARH